MFLCLPVFCLGRFGSESYLIAKKKKRRDGGENIVSVLHFERLKPICNEGTGLGHLVNCIIWKTGFSLNERAVTKQRKIHAQRCALKLWENELSFIELTAYQTCM